MGSSAPFSDLVYLELRDRYDRLRRRSDAVAVVAPDTALAQAVAAVAEVACPGEGLRQRVHYAGETYEYVLQRWHDPRWRAMVAVARAFQRCGDATPTPYAAMQASPARKYRKWSQHQLLEPDYQAVAR